MRTEDGDMSFIRLLRVGVAVAVGLVVFGATALGILTLAALGRLGLVPHAWLDQAPRHGCAVVCLVPRFVLGVRIAVDTSRVAPIAPDEQIVVIANHPSFVGITIFAWLLGAMLDRSITFVGKHEFRNNPFVGWPLRLLNAGIFIHREDRNAALTRLSSDVPDAFASGAAIMILPDQSRPTRAKIIRDRAKFVHDIQAIFAFTETLVPRVGGLRQILASAKGKVRVIDVTAGFNRNDFGISDVLGLVGATYTFSAEDITGELPRDAHELRDVITRRWITKNERLRNLKSS